MLQVVKTVGNVYCKNITKAASRRLEKKYFYVMEFRTAKETEKIFLWAWEFGGYMLYQLFIPAAFYDQEIQGPFHQSWLDCL